MQLKGVIGNKGHVLPKSGDLHHVERGAKLNSLRRLTFDGDGHNDRWCTRKVDDRFGLEGEPRPKSYVDVLVGTPKVVSHVDGGRFGLEEQILRASTKSPSCGRSLRCRDDCATKNTSAVHERCIG